MATVDLLSTEIALELGEGCDNDALYLAALCTRAARRETKAAVKMAVAD